MVCWLYLDLHVSDSEPIFLLAVSHSEEESAKSTRLSFLLPFVLFLYRLRPLSGLWPVQLTFLEQTHRQVLEVEEVEGPDFVLNHMSVLYSNGPSGGK